MSLTVTDLFAGAGGSSTGMVAVPGVEVKIAANHWQTAIDIHNTNHPDTDHAIADLHQADPHYFPRTDILWASPECTKWSQANGSPLPDIDEGLFEDPLSSEAADRSRMLMFDVPRFMAVHRYRRVIVENVVDIAMLPKYATAWRVWQGEIRKLGYRFRVVSLNSMHAQFAGPPAPQSRDRLYVVCWLDGDRAPDIDRVMRPKAWCPRCEVLVESRQAWKNGRTVGRYRAQYVYVCATCGDAVEPGWLPAAAAIDWALPGQRIGDRAKPLADKTRARIAAGIARYWRPFTLEAAGNHVGLVTPAGGSWNDDARTTDETLRALTTRDAYALVAPYYSGAEAAKPASEPVGALTTHDRYALIHRHNTGGAEMLTPSGEVLRTLTTKGHQSVITPGDLAAADTQVDDCLFRMFEPHEVAAGQAFPGNYQWQPYPLKTISRRDLVKAAGNAVTPPSARDLMWAVVESLDGAA
jgi:DNA (cytosine-5)-methyltransferase 1